MMNYLWCFFCVVTTIHVVASLSTAQREDDSSNVVVVETGWSDAQKESESFFECPPDEVLVGREHDGDENGRTRYKCALLFTDDKRLLVPYYTGAWSEWHKESRSTYVCPGDKVMTGREHEGDENGSTRYKCSNVIYEGKTLYYKPGLWSNKIKESNSLFVCPQNQVMIGRSHHGDENGYTKYLCAIFAPA